MATGGPTTNQNTVIILGFIVLACLIWLTRPQGSVQLASGQLSVTAGQVVVSGVPVTSQGLYVPVKMGMWSGDRIVTSVKAGSTVKIVVTRERPVAAYAPPLAVHLLYAVEIPAGGFAPDPRTVLTPTGMGLMQPNTNTSSFDVRTRRPATVWIFAVTGNGESCFERLEITP